jgi:hypothetical protein
MKFSGDTQGSSKNGEPFDNKIARGQYYRWIPGYECKGKAIILGKIDVKDSGVHVQTLNPENCALENRAVGETDLEPLHVSMLSNEVLGFENSIYVKEPQPVDAQSPPPIGGEAWCKGSELSMLVIEDAAAKILKSELRVGGVVKQMSGLQRSLDAKKLVYAAPQVRLEIQRTTVQHSQNWSGVAEYRDAKTGQLVKMPVSCRLGLKLDRDNHFFPEWKAELFGPSLPAGVLVQRASLASYFDPSGVMRFAGAGAPRFGHDPVSGMPLGLMVESAATNLLPYSQSLENWTLSGYNVEANSPQSSAPDGSQTAEFFRVGTAVSGHQILQNFIPLPTGKYTFSVYAKAASTNPQKLLRLQILNLATGNQIWANFDLISKTVDMSLADGDGSVTAASVELLRNGWMRLKLSGIPSASSTEMQVFFETLDYSTSVGVYGDPLQRGFFLWGAQLESGDLASSYINSDTGVPTRAEDRLNVDSSGWFNASAPGSTLMFEVMTNVDALRSTASAKRMLAATDPSGDVMAVEYDPITQALQAVFPGLGLPMSTAPFAPTPNSLVRAVIGSSPDGAQAFTVNGVDQSGSAPIGAFGATNISLGGVGQTEKTPGYYQSLRYWPFLMEPATRNLLTQ